MRTTAMNAVPSASRQLCRGFDSAASRTGTTSGPVTAAHAIWPSSSGSSVNSSVDRWSRPASGTGAARPSATGGRGAAPSSCSGRVGGGAVVGHDRVGLVDEAVEVGAELLLVVAELVGAAEAERVGVQLDRRTVRTEAAHDRAAGVHDTGHAEVGVGVVEGVGVGDRLLEALQVGAEATSPARRWPRPSGRSSASGARTMKRPSPYTVIDGTGRQRDLQRREARPVGHLPDDVAGVASGGVGSSTSWPSAPQAVSRGTTSTSLAALAAVRDPSSGAEHVRRLTWRRCRPVPSRTSRLDTRQTPSAS